MQPGSNSNKVNTRKFKIYKLMARFGRDDDVIDTVMPRYIKGKKLYLKANF